MLYGRVSLIVLRTRLGLVFITHLYILVSKILHSYSRPLLLDFSFVNSIFNEMWYLVLVANMRYLILSFRNSD